MSSASASEAEEAPPLLAIRNLDLWFDTEQGRVHAVRGISPDVPAGRTLGLVGESGCGKSVTALSILRLLSRPAGRIAAGEIRLNGTDLVALSETEMRRILEGGEGFSLVGHHEIMFPLLAAAVIERLEGSW